MGLWEDFRKGDNKGSGGASIVACALASPRSCCQGRGFIFKVEGAFAQAELCSCVRSCSRCLGYALIEDAQGRSRSCVTPPPTRVVNQFNQAHLPARYVSASLTGFTNFSGNGREVVAEMKAWLDQFQPRGRKGLLLSGPVGVGKTFLLASLAKSLAIKGYSVAFVDFFQLLSRLRDSYAADQTDAVVLKPLLEVDVLIIDELGKGRNSDWELTVVDQLVMGRYNEGKVIVATTNYTLKEEQVTLDSQRDLEMDYNTGNRFATAQFGPLVGRVGPRIYSRLKEMCRLMELTGGDFRKNQG